MEMYTFVRLLARPGQENALAAAMRDVLAPTRNELGCLSCNAFRSKQDPRLFFFHSRWKDEAAFEIHAALPHTVQFLKRVEPLLSQPLEVARTEPLVVPKHFDAAAKQG